MSIVGDLVANLTANVSGFIAPMQSAIRMVGVFGAGFSFVEAINSFRESEQAAKKLDAVLTATEGAAGLTADEITGFANELQGLTNFEGDATVAAAAVLATFKEIKGQTFKDAIVSAQDLSAVMGQDLQGSIVQIGKALNDPVKGVTALQRVGVSFTQQQKDQIKLLQESGDLAGAQAIVLGELKSEFGGAAKAMADPFTKLWNITGDIVEMVGGAMVPALNLVADEIIGYLVPNMEAFQESFSWASKLAIDFASTAIGYVKDSFKLLGVVIVQWETVTEFAFKKAELNWLKFRSFFSVLTTWMRDNWFEIIKDMASIVMVFNENVERNFINLGEAMFDFLATGDWQFEPVGLLDGFESSLKELPDMASRTITDTERQLEKDVAKLGATLEDRFGEALIDGAVPKAMEAAKELTDATFLGTSLALAGGAPDIAKANASVMPEQAKFAGTAEALKAIFGSRQGATQEQMLSVQQQSLEYQKQQADSLKRLEEMGDGEEVFDL